MKNVDDTIITPAFEKGLLKFCESFYGFIPTQYQLLVALFLHNEI
jgi:hypothetical protein